MKYYQKLDIENFDVITDELLQYVQPQIAENLRYWDISAQDLSKNTPLFFNFVEQNFYMLPILFRFYHIPPFSTLAPHIDNTKEAKNKIGFNIPLYGTKNSTMDYYTTPEENLELTYNGFAKMPTQLIKDKSKLVHVDSVEIDRPTLVRTDMIHGVINQKDTRRLVLGLKCLGSTFEQVYKFNK
jgi:hypothetical protein